MSGLKLQFVEQAASNASGLSHYEAFRGHRERFTQLARQQATGGGRRLCVLGAGNCYDLELPVLLSHFSEVHLVDIDAAAIQAARTRLDLVEQARVFTHAPLDASGMFEHLERWAKLQVTPQELLAAPTAGAKQLAAALPGPFDVVVSACLLTQLQLTLLNLLGDGHPLFAALREFLTLTHLRVLSLLTSADGRALLVTDLCESSVFPEGRPRDEADLAPLMDELVQAGHVIHSAHPGLLKLTLQDDPVLLRTFEPAQLSPPWLWQNGPERRFLVYGMALQRRASSAPTPRA